MLTKLLRPESASSVEPVLWRRATGPTAIKEAEQPQRSEAASGTSAAIDPALLEQIRTLEGRLAAQQVESEQKIRQARDAGLREGEANGRSQAAAQIQPVLDRLARSLNDIAGLRTRLRHDAESDLVNLSLAIAKKILHRELATDPDAIAGLVKASIEKIRIQEIAKVRIHPQHHAPVEQILARLPGGNQIELVADPKLDTGAVLIETQRGQFDASVDLQLKEIERGLTDRLASHK